MNQPGSFKSLEDWLPWLETLSPREIVLGLERVQLVLERLDLTRPSLVINIAGTNGKGSSAAMLESLLGKGGMHTGCYTSPHVRRYNERIRIGGRPAADEAIVSALELVESVRGNVPLTFFEFGTLAALVVFDAARVDAWILEVGMGGRLDAVNAIEPDASLITNVSLDHCAWLGDDVETIATEKAGIMRASKPVVFGSPDLPEAIPALAARLGAELRVADQDFSFAAINGDSGGWSWHGQRIRLPALQRPGLRGTMQMQNASAVLATLEALNLDHLLRPEIVNEALQETMLEGRFQIVEKQCRWILDVAHNPDAARILADLLGQQKVGGNITAIVGMLADKDVAGVIEPLCGLVDRWIAVSVSAGRAQSATILAGKIANVSRQPCLLATSTTDACRMAAERAASGDAILVTGSFYLVGPVLDWLHSH
jgi:dihydrofolate synthase/folylpolyglutamate synthase